MPERCSAASRPSASLPSALLGVKTAISGQPAIFARVTVINTVDTNGT